jgi:hypothetical protein
MTAHSRFTQRRAIYQEGLQARLDAAMVRTRRFLNSTQAIRASVRSQHTTPFTSFCPNCQEPGHPHDSPPTCEQHYICAHCHRRWVTLPSAS